jgi:hypothetical protein
MFVSPKKKRETHICNLGINKDFINQKHIYTHIPKKKPITKRKNNKLEISVL